MSCFMKRCPVETESFHADGQTDRQTDGQTDMMKLIVAFRKFANMPKNNFEKIQKEIVFCYVKQANNQNLT